LHISQSTHARQTQHDPSSHYNFRSIITLYFVLTVHGHGLEHIEALCGDENGAITSNVMATVRIWRKLGGIAIRELRGMLELVELGELSQCTARGQI